MFHFVRTRLFGPKLSQEAAEAYFYRLPKEIQVAWLRDGDFIVGKIKTTEHEFMTQGHNADEFIDMVNDAILAAYDIPRDYLDLMRRAHAYTPTLQEHERLESQEVRESSFSLQKQHEALRVA